MEYYDLCPLTKYEISHVFEIDDNGDILYRSSQTTGMPYDACRIWLEVVLDKADPDYLTFIGTSYMVIYSYVLSPLLMSFGEYIMRHMVQKFSTSKRV